MSENTTTPDPVAQQKAEDFDFDAWLSGAERTARYVTLYGNGSALAELARVNAAIEQAETVKERSLSDPGTATLQAEAQRLREEIAKTSMEVRVEASIEDEIDAARVEARKSTREARKAAEDAARADAVESAKALQLPAKEEHAAIVSAVAEASDGVVNAEIAAAILADRVQVKRGGQWKPIGRPALDQLRSRLGEPQYEKLREAWQSASSDRPEALTVPSSPER